MQGGDIRCEGVAFSPDGKLLATAISEGLGSWRGIKFWDVSTGKLRRQIAADGSSGVDYLTFSPGGTFLIGATFSTVEIYTVADLLDDKLDAAIAELAKVAEVQRRGPKIVVSMKEGSPEASLAALQKLPSITDLDISSVRELSDAGVAYLEPLINLENLRLTGFGSTSKITDTGLAQLSGLTKLQVLSLRYCANLTDAGLEHLAALTELRELHLSDTRVTGAGLVHLKRLKKLEKLELPRLFLDDGAVMNLAGLTALTHLNLQNTGISDDGLQRLQTLVNLSSLNLRKRTSRMPVSERWGDSRS